MSIQGAYRCPRYIRTLCFVVQFRGHTTLETAGRTHFQYGSIFYCIALYFSTPEVYSFIMVVIFQSFESRLTLVVQSLFQRPKTQTRADGKMTTSSTPQLYPAITGSLNIDFNSCGEDYRSGRWLSYTRQPHYSLSSH